MNIQDLVKAKKVEDLKAFGGYFDTKNNLESQLGFKLGVNGWHSLHEKLYELRMAVKSNKDKIYHIYWTYPLDKSKEEISDILDVDLTVKDKEELKDRVDDLICFFYISSYDPYRKYEESKLKNFKNSSKLEGIDIDISNKNKCLSSILSKYKRKVHG